MPDFIYPRDFFRAQEEERQRGLCFVLMPFADEYRQVYDGVIKPTVEESGMQCFRADDIYSPRPILVTVMEQIARAELIISDLSGRNPNVFYEVGLAHVVTSNEQVILISRAMEDVPFDLRHLRLIIYDESSEGLVKLKTELQKALQSLGLAEFPDKAVALPSEEETATGSTDAVSTLLAGWEWSNVEVSFSPSDETHQDLQGRVRAGLLKWFEYENIKGDWLTTNFPEGQVQGGLSAGPELSVTRQHSVDLDELASVVASRYEAVSYRVDVPFEPADLVKHLKSLNLPISYVSDSRITVTPDAIRRAGFIDLAHGDDHTIVRLRAPEQRAYSTSEGLVPFEEIMACLTGKLSVEEFSKALI